MSSFKPKDYLTHLPECILDFEEHEWLQKEYKRVSTAIEMPSLDMSRYELNPPVGKNANDAKSWTEAIQNAQAQIEQQNTRILNLELLQQYGTDLWKVHNAQLASAAEMYTRQVDLLKEQSRKINMERKRDQMMNRDKLFGLVRKRLALAQSNRNIQVRRGSSVREAKHESRFGQSREKY